MKNTKKTTDGNAVVLEQSVLGTMQVDKNIWNKFTVSNDEEASFKSVVDIIEDMQANQIEWIMGAGRFSENPVRNLMEAFTDSIAKTIRKTNNDIGRMSDYISDRLKSNNMDETDSSVVANQEAIQFAELVVTQLEELGGNTRSLANCFKRSGGLEVKCSFDRSNDYNTSKSNAVIGKSGSSSASLIKAKKARLNK